MNHSFGKHVLVTAVAIVALLCMAWPAQALKETTGGMGKHLLFAQWTTMNYRDTYIAIHSPLGVKSDLTMQDMNMVTVMIRGGGMPELTEKMYGGGEVKQAASLAEFRICLEPGDTWTATLTTDGAKGSMLMVGDAGECDSSVYITDADMPGRGEDPDMVPMVPKMGTEYSIDGQMGFVEAYSSARQSVDEDGEISFTEDADGDMEGRDEDGDEDDMTDSMSITGTAYLVSPMMGFASNYNAVALMCHDFDEEATAVRECRHNLDSDGTTADTENEINTALTGGVTAADAPANTERKLLMGRWVTEPMIGAMTDVVLTFPGTNTLNYQTLDKGEDADGALDDMDVPAIDPVSLFVFDEMGNIVAESRELMLGMAVNMCSFRSMMMDGDMMDGDMMDGDMMDGMSYVMCNGKMVGDPFMATGGTFRIHNRAVSVSADGNEDNVAGVDAAGTDVGAGIPSMKGMILGGDANNVGLTGEELSGYDLDTNEMDLNEDGDTGDEGETPTLNSIPAIGLVMQVFDNEKNAGKTFDLLAPIWHTGDPDIPNP